MRKLFSASAVVLSAALALTGCAGVSTSKSEAKSSGELTVWVDQNREPGIKAVADKFQSDTGVKLKIVVKQFEEIKASALAEIPTGKGPDVFIGANDITGTLVKNGVVQPIELGSKKSEYLPIAVNGFTYDGKTYGVPVQIDNLALVRNTQLAPKAPASWDDMIKTGNELVASGKASMPIAIQQGATGDAYHLYPVQASFGAPVFELNTDGTYNPKKLAMCGPEGQMFAKKLAEFSTTSPKIIDAALTQDVAKDQFAQGKVAYMVTGNWNLAAFQKGAVGKNYAIEQIPSAGGKDATPFVGSQGFFISAKTTQQLAATKFVVDYMGSQDVQSTFFASTKRTPANQKSYDAAKSDKDAAAFGAVGQKGVAMPNVPAMDSVWKFWGNTQIAIEKGAATDPAAAWNTMCEAIKKDIG